MDTKRTKSYEIYTGPNRGRLFDACKYAYDSYAKITVGFGVIFGYTMPPGHPGGAYVQMEVEDIVITGIEHDVGPGQFVNLHGHCAANPTGKLDHWYFQAHYSTKTRRGTISFHK